VGADLASECEGAAIIEYPDAVTGGDSAGVGIGGVDLEQR
jgi:hypothetical protein